MPEPIPEQVLRDAVHAEDLAALLALFLGMPETERRKHASAMIEELEVFADDFRCFSTRKSDLPQARLSTAKAAVLATASFPQLCKLGWTCVPDTETCIAILRDRRPDWADDFAVWRSDWWWVVRPLVLAGVCQKPTHEKYLQALAMGFRFQPKAPKTRAEWLLEDPELLEDEIWRLFEMEGTSEANLAAVDKYNRSPNTWSDAFLELSRLGKLDRQRLLDKSLASLAGDFPQFRAGWFSRFHEAMQPSVEERIGRIDAYLGLLGSAIPPTGVMALDALLVIDKARPLDAARIFPHLHFLVLAKAKGTAKKALQWVAAIHKREPACLPSAAALMRTGLRHEAAEIQALALAFLEKHPVEAGGEAREELSALLDSVSSVLKPRLHALLGSRAPQPEASPPVARPAMAPAKIHPLDPDRLIPAIMDPEDLLEQATRAIEAPLDFALMEQVFHGMALLPVKRDEAFVKLASALRKRLAKLLRTGGYRSHGASCEAIGSWLDGGLGSSITDPLQQELTLWRGEAIWGHRARFAAILATGEKRLPLPATPTHRGGWIDPQILVQRCLAWHVAGVSPPPEELALALLRLAPEGRAEALAASKGLQGEGADALRFALGAEGIPIGPTTALWIAAARSRDPDAQFPELEKRHPGRGPDAAIPARYLWKMERVSREYGGKVYWYHYLRIAIEPTPDPERAADSPLLQFHLRERHGTSHLVEWSATLWPANLEPWLSQGAILIFDQYEVDHHLKAYLEALLDPIVPLLPMARLALACGLGCKAPEIRTLATDLLITALESGRLEASSLGEILARLRVDSGIPLQRWQKCLAETARVSPFHLKAVKELLETTLQGDPSDVPRDLGKLLELLLELHAADGTRLESLQTRAFLADIRASGAAGKLAKALLA